MQDKVNMIFKQVDNPGRWCSSGHIAPEKFKAEENGEAEPTRFFQVTGNGITGIYCEPCLCISNYLSRQIKKNKTT